MEIQELQFQIEQGLLDPHLTTIQAACDVRKRQLSYTQLHSLREGDRVQFIEGRPRYLIGVQATVVKVMQTWATVRLDRPIGKFTDQIRCPMSTIKKVP